MIKRGIKWKISVGEMIQICGLIITATVLGVRFDSRLERLENHMISMDGRLTKLENLVNLDLSWRYPYQNDPMRKHLRPIYHPDTRTLELVPINTTEPATP